MKGLGERLTEVLKEKGAALVCGGAGARRERKRKFQKTGGRAPPSALDKGEKMGYDTSTVSIFKPLK